MEKIPSIKIKIIPSVQQGFLLAFKTRKHLLYLGWLTFVIFSLYGILDMHFFITSMISQAIEDMTSIHITSNLIYNIIAISINSALIISIFRFFITGGKQHYIWEPKRGIAEKKTVLSLPWYFKLSKREFIFTLTAILLILSIYIFKKTLIFLVLENQIDYGAIRIDDTTIFLTSFLIWLSKSLVLALSILIWPYISSTDKFSVSHMFLQAAAIRGNIVRVFVIIQILTIPYIATSYLLGYIYYIIATSQPSFLHSLIGEQIGIIYGLILIISNIALYICIYANCIFSSLIYKKLKYPE